MGDAAGSKRCRDEPAEFPETKRLKEADLILEILDDDVAGGVDIAVDQGLDDVIKSLEEEMAVAAGPPQAQGELGYLLEASDDELGLPPAAAGGTSSSEATEGGDVAEVVDEESRFGHELWAFEEEMLLGPYVGPEFGILENERGIFENGDCLWGEGGLSFDCSYLDSGPLDYSDLTWQGESLPSV